MGGKGGEEKQEKRKNCGFRPHARQLCKLKVSAASQIPLKNGDIYRRLALAMNGPLLCHTHSYYYYYFICTKMENISNLRGLQRQSVHARCLTPCACVCACHRVSPHVREKPSACETEGLQQAKKRSERTELEKEQKNREKLACIEGCNLIY